MAGAWLLAVGLLVGAASATAFADTPAGGANDTDGHSSTTTDSGGGTDTENEPQDPVESPEDGDDTRTGVGPTEEPATTDPADAAATDPAEEATTDPADDRPLAEQPVEPSDSDSAYDTPAADSDEVVTVPEIPTAPATPEEIASTPSPDTSGDNAPGAEDPASPPTAPVFDVGAVIEDFVVTIVGVLKPVVTAPTALAAPMPEFAPGPPNENRPPVAGAGASLSPLGMLRMLAQESAPATAPHAVDIPTLLDGAQHAPSFPTAVTALADPAATVSAPVGSRSAAPDPPLFEELREILQSKGTILIAAVSLSAMFLAALPGLAGIAIPGAAGVGIGYRQAKAMRALRGSGIAHLAPTGPIGVVRSASVVELRPSRRRAHAADSRPAAVSALSA